MNGKNNQSVYDAAEGHRKLFIGGLNLSTTDEMLKEFYTQWGEVIDCIVMKDPQTRKSRGFGFITYKDTESIDIAQAARPHKIDGRVVDPKRAIPRGESGKNDMFSTSKKLFISGLKDEDNLGNEDLKDHFLQYGNISECDIKFDADGKKRGFAFITFDDYDSVDKAVLHKPHIINGAKLMVKKAINREDNFSNRGGGGRGQSRNNMQNNRGYQGRGFNNNRNMHDNYNDNGYYGNDMNNFQKMFGAAMGMGMNPMGGMNPMMGMGGGMGMNNMMPGFNDMGNYGNSYGGGPMRNPGMNSNARNNMNPYNTGHNDVGNFGMNNYGNGGF